jgi:ligand-binding sensor domain-containing protein
MNLFRRVATIKCLFLLVLLFFLRNSYSFPLFTNYQATTSVNDIAISGPKVWAASSGGLFVYDYVNKSSALYNDITHFPDINLTAICMDSQGDLWIGSSLGYLYKQTPNGLNYAYNSYFGSNWDIKTLYAYKNYIIIGSSKGASIFDETKGVAIGNATTIDTFSNSAVYAITVHNDSLYVGCVNGYASINVAGNLISANNYADPSSWSSVTLGSSVVSFIDSSGVLLPQNAPSVLAGPTIYRAVNGPEQLDSSHVNAQNNSAFVLPSSITKLTKDDNNNLWIGTANNYLNFWNKTGSSQINILGLTYNNVYHLLAARNGTVWVEPQTSSKVPDRWYEGITLFDGKKWTLYNEYSAPNFGVCGDYNLFSGICEDRSGTMWFGAPGGGIKRFNISTNQWTRYYLNGWNASLPDFMEITDPSVPSPEEQCEAVAQDSSGFMWFANLGNVTHNNARGSLICFDPSTNNYLRYFPYGDSNYIPNIISLSVDFRGRILAGGDQGNLLIFSHNGHPLQSGNTSILLFRTDFGKVSAMSSTPSGTIWIATKKGLYKYNSDANTLDSIPTAKVPVTVNSVAAESEGVLWLGTSADGLIRYSISDSVTTIFNMTNGLASNNVNDVTIDKKNGCLWVATGAGLSRMGLGDTSTILTDNKNIQAYPNPFSQTNPNHHEIIFKHCAFGSKVFIYTLRGALMKILSPDVDNAYPFTGNGSETTLRWVPPKNIVPGMYYYVGQPAQSAKTQKLLFIP